MKSGVYKITNTINGKFYVGSAVDIDHRWDEHRQYLRGNYHINPKFQHAWNKYGENVFVFEVLEEVVNPTKALLFERENHYLQLLKPYERNVGYNICLKAQGGDTLTHHPIGQKIIQRWRDKYSKLYIGKGNPMFGKKHSENAVIKQKTKAIGRYTLDWFVQRYGQINGQKKFEERRKMLMTRNINYVTDPNASYMSFKGKKHKSGFKEKSNASKTYFKEHWDEFVNLVTSGKYSQRQLSTMLGISRVSLKVRMKEVSSQQKTLSEFPTGL